jgi:hypothetical protein
MPPAGLVPTIPANDWPQTNALDRAAIGIDMLICVYYTYSICIYIYIYRIEKNEMGGACSADGKESGVYRVLVGNLREGDTWETQA